MATATPPKRRRISQSAIHHVLARQHHQCANRPDAPLFAAYKCPLWQSRSGEFDEAGFQLDHIREHCLTEDDDAANLQALCAACHQFKSKAFASSQAPTRLARSSMLMPVQKRKAAKAPTLLPSDPLFAAVSAFCQARCSLDDFRSRAVDRQRE